METLVRIFFPHSSAVDRIVSWLQDMLRMVSRTAPYALLATTAELGRYYPPAADSHLNLTWALNSTGPPGIFNSSHTPDEQYGVYSWCSMPHVRAREYTKPEGAELVYLEVIQRHHKRTPYASNTFFHEDVTFDCADHGPYHHAKGGTRVFWQAQRGTENPFQAPVGPGFGNSTCQFPGITKSGLEDSREHGGDFGSVYRDMLGFLPRPEEKDIYSFRVTNNVITTQTLSGFVSGAYPDVEEYAAWVQPASFDSLEPTFPCPAADRLLQEIKAHPNRTNHLSASSALGKRFDAVSGIPQNDTAGWHTSWDHAFDNLSSKQCHGLSLPCSMNDTRTCVSQEDADAIYRLGQWEYAYLYRGSPEALRYSALKMGAWFAELRAHLADAASSSSSVKYLHNFAHDGSLAPILGILQIAHPVWPGMGAEVVFELWRRRGDHFMRVLFGGRPLVSSALGTLDMLPVQSFESYLEAVIPGDLVAACR